MGDNDRLAERFELDRRRLRAVAYRMLGSVHEADDAVQEAWLRLGRPGASGVENLSGFGIGTSACPPPVSCMKMPVAGPPLWNCPVE